MLTVTFLPFQSIYSVSGIRMRVLTTLLAILTTLYYLTDDENIWYSRGEKPRV